MSRQSTDTDQQFLRNLPSVASLIDDDLLRDAKSIYGHEPVAAAAREVVAQLRNQLLSGPIATRLPSTTELTKRILAHLKARNRPPLRPVINATGILLHTGLGRAPLAEEAIDAASEAARGYCSVELDLGSGERTVRARTVERLLCELTGAEAAHVVNNNAGATGLTVAAIAAGRELIVSHGELIEIGGGFRLPDVIEAYGAKLRPVGTTNKTHLADYTKVLGEQTGALLVVHPSNFAVVGFAQKPTLESLIAIAKQHQLPLVHDVGSGALIDFTPFGCQGEPIVGQSIRAGADLVLFSGDKLLGGPQCGILVGRKDLVHQIAKHPFSRALRVDKTTLAALHATLQIYKRGNPTESIPLLKLLSTPLGQLRTRAEQLAERLQSDLPTWEVATSHDTAQVGGGSLPHQSLSSWSVTITPPSKISVDQFSKALRQAEPAIVARIERSRVILCLHAVFAEQDQSLAETIVAAASERFLRAESY